MASEVDICNLALAYLGDSATVVVIDPPEASVQAELCSRFYPVARDALLEMHPWAFATQCVQLAQLETTRPEWRFAYAAPADVIRVLAVIAAGAADLGDGVANARPYSLEADATGAAVIFTNEPNALARYIGRTRDTTRFSPLFVQALAWHLASMLAGPLLKGDVGAAESKRCIGMMQGYFAQASQVDANERNVRPVARPDWMRARGATAAPVWGRQ